MTLTAAEERMAKEPGLAGRIWHGQGLIFDEGYGILMLLGILTDPKQASCSCVCVPPGSSASLSFPLWTCRIARPVCFVSDRLEIIDSMP